MTSAHLVARAADADLAVPAVFAGHSRGFRRWSVVDERVPGAAHTGFAIGALDAGGRVEAHVHSYEASFFVMDGELVMEMPDGAARLVPGDYGVIPIGVPHGWRNDGAAVARWAAMSAPQPRRRFRGDTYFVDVESFESGQAAAVAAVDVRDPRTRRFGHIEPSNMDVDRQTQDNLAVSASMRTALLVYSGITVKMMVDTDLGAQLQTMFMVQYEERGRAGPHDHPFEETYLILEGATDAELDGEHYRLEPGDIAWAGVGCVHGFTNPGPGVVRWLETQAPQPPGRHSYRFRRDWDYLEGRRP